jgi:hypothetical protein
MELDWNIACLEALRELREENERRTSTGAKLVRLIKARAWDLAATRCPPGHA